MNQFNKVKYIKILEILSQNSDSDRPMKSSSLLSSLKSEGIELDRRTLYSDMKILTESGYKICCNRAKQNEYYLEDRKFTIPELRILMDAVESLNSISESRSKALLEKRYQKFRNM